MCDVYLCIYSWHLKRLKWKAIWHPSPESERKPRSGILCDGTLCHPTPTLKYDLGWDDDNNQCGYLSVDIACFYLCTSHINGLMCAFAVSRRKILIGLQCHLTLWHMPCPFLSCLDSWCWYLVSFVIMAVVLQPFL